MRFGPLPLVAIAAPAPPPIALDPAAIDAWLADELRARGAVGAAAAVVRDGATIFAKGYGTRAVGTRAPIGPDTPFSIGSVSKQLTCAAALLLADDGKLAMDDKVAKYYPQLTRAGDITLDDLGAHLAGYRDYYPLDYLDARMAAPIVPDDLLAKYAGMPLDFEPRSRGSYSNTGFMLLARIVERVSGLAFGTFLHQRIFAPLGMTHSSFGAPPPDAASGHDAFLLGPVERTTPEATGWALGAFGVYASAADLVRWDLALSTGEILSDASRRTLTSPHRTADGRYRMYGCGLSMRIERGETVLSHSGAVEGFHASNTFVPRTRSAVVLLVNDARVDLSDLDRVLVALLLQHPADIPTVPGPPPATVALDLVRQLQRGRLDRSALGDDFNGWLDDKRLATVATRLRVLGDPSVTITERGERGAMEVTKFDLVFPARTLHATMFRSPLGKIHQFLIAP